MLQLCDALHHCLAGLRLQLLPRGILLLVDVHPIRVVDPSGEDGFHFPDTLFGEVALLGIFGEEDHVDMHLIWVLVERSIPTQVSGRILYAFAISQMEAFTRACQFSALS